MQILHFYLVWQKCEASIKCATWLCNWIYWGMFTTKSIAYNDTGFTGYTIWVAFKQKESYTLKVRSYFIAILFTPHCTSSFKKINFSTVCLCRYDTLSIVTHNSTEAVGYEQTFSSAIKLVQLKNKGIIIFLDIFHLMCAHVCKKRTSPSNTTIALAWYLSVYTIIFPH